jgi:hypothetical protein
MRARRDLGIFAVSCVAWSLLLSAVVWSVPSVAGYAPGASIITVTIASVILSARGSSWMRKAAFALGMVSAFAVADAAFFFSGGMAYVMNAPVLAPLAVVLGIVYLLIEVALPITVLLVFVGGEPSVLWTESSNNGTAAREDRRESSRRRGR